MPEAPFGVLLVAYGAPLDLEEVEPYLLDVRGGRPTPPELVEELRARYAAIGGRSPLLDHTRRQAQALQQRLGGLPVLVGMRHWRPYVREALEQARQSGLRRLVALALAPHYSHISIGAYQRAIEAARDTIEIAFVPHWYDHPRFLDAVARKLARALERFPAAERPAVPIVFTAHSIPQRLVREGDPYPEQLRTSASAVIARLGPHPWHLAYQSAGRSPEPWLGPDAGDLLAELAAQGVRQALICPIGFVADHLEVLYDVDIEYQRLAHDLGIRLERTESLNADPLLIEALADLVTTAASTRGWG